MTRFVLAAVDVGSVYHKTARVAMHSAGVTRAAITCSTTYVDGLAQLSSGGDGDSGGAL
jgi:hypothetical protein